MTSEYDFAVRELPGLRPNHQFFFYENQLPYQQLDQIITETPVKENNIVPTYILGNSSTPELNHLDAVTWMDREGVRANLKIPVSYGDSGYARFLKNNLSFYKGGKIEFVDRYQSIHEYLQLLYQSDGLVMNNIRPQGYGNILMMLYLGKQVFMNEKNLSTAELTRQNLIWQPIKEMKKPSESNLHQNKQAVLALLSHETLLKRYRELFS